MLMEIMGLHLPGSAFVAPGSPLRDALTRAAAQRAIALGPQGDSFTPVAEVISEKTLVNGIVGLLATGGSTNHTLQDRKRVGEGKSVSGRVDLGGRRFIKKKKK